MILSLEELLFKCVPNEHYISINVLYIGTFKTWNQFVSGRGARLRSRRFYQDDVVDVGNCTHGLWNFFRGLDFSFSQQYTAQTPHATTLKIVLIFMRTMRKTMLAEMQKSYSSDCSFHDGVFSSGVL